MPHSRTGAGNYTSLKKGVEGDAEQTHNVRRTLDPIRMLSILASKINEARFMLFSKTGRFGFSVFIP